MRGDDQKQAAMFSYITLEQRIPADHPARQIRVLVDRALERMDGELEKLYSDTGRPSIAPERLLRATFLMILFSVRSERQLMERVHYDLLYRWFPPQRRRPVAGDPGVCGPGDGRPGVGRDGVHQEPGAGGLVLSADHRGAQLGAHAETDCD